VVLNMGGLHNVENSIAAIGVAMELRIEKEKVKKAVAGFRGVKRRFEYIVRNEQYVMIDDYAHHPEELRGLINSVKMLFPEKQCVLIFQPHLFSRTKDLADGFAEVLDMADEVMLLPIYPARELPVEGVTSALISERMNSERVKLMEKDEIISRLRKDKDQFKGRKVLVTAGAGDIDRMIDELKNILAN